MFTAFMNSRYPGIKTRYPAEGRRKWRLRVAEEFWNLSAQDFDALPSEVFTDEDTDDGDSDLLDDLTEREEPGLLVRTDFSNEDSWNLFIAKFQNAEQELADALKSPTSDVVHDGDIAMADPNATEEGEDDDDHPTLIIHVLNAESSHLKALFDNKSNLAILRLLNDVDVRKAPDPPYDAKPIKPSSRLTAKRGYQEVYYGKNIWIYDAQSNVDECVRAVNQIGDMYGTASGDSWRARVTHICELQFNMSFLGMKIDFGGLDRWDYSERLRNVKEADIEII
ncbi:hypothetical protein BDQ17DRAFT_1401254 [Cyathus striatus]|nr:hypothetical protein BDQ17DRAFT_1401254 [Cyathus striatus]